ncbi:MAG: class I SAM-dependent methyltransferase [Spirochaetes bacterium]|nr:class I SAM-dependent methyltransferase [Spirochaetota bacterium]
MAPGSQYVRVTRMISKLFSGLMISMVNISPVIKKQVWRFVYWKIAHPRYDVDFLLMNYGYRYPGRNAAGIPFEDFDKPFHHSIQLYHKVASGVPLAGKDVLEIGCGRGGGAAYINRTFMPRGMTGIDFSARSIAFGVSYHREVNLRFLHGDAESLPLKGESYDAVISVESSHCCSSFERFIAEVGRVLRPGGHFLLADFRTPRGVQSIRIKLARIGFMLLHEEDITANVLGSMEMTHDYKLRNIEEKSPLIYRKFIRQFSGTIGSQAFQYFRNGSWEYRYFIFQKITA